MATARTYRIMRNYSNGGSVVKQTGLTLEEAQEHCRNPESSSRTATNPLIDERGDWFDGYTNDGRNHEARVTGIAWSTEGVGDSECRLTMEFIAGRDLIEDEHWEVFGDALAEYYATNKG